MLIKGQLFRAPPPSREPFVVVGTPKHLLFRVFVFHAGRRGSPREACPWWGWPGMAPARFRCLRLQIAWAPNGTKAPPVETLRRARVAAKAAGQRGEQPQPTLRVAREANEETKPEVGNDTIKGRL